VRLIMADEKKPAAAEVKKEVKKKKLPKGRHLSVIKRARQSVKRAERNLPVRSALKTVIKKVLKAVEKKEKTVAQTALKEATSLLHKAAVKGLVHHRNAARHIARLSRHVAKIAA